MLVAEKQGSVTLSLNLTNPSSSDITVIVITTDGTATGEVMVNMLKIRMYVPFIQKVFKGKYFEVCT